MTTRIVVALNRYHTVGVTIIYFDWSSIIIIQLAEKSKKKQKVVKNNLLLITKLSVENGGANLVKWIEGSNLIILSFYFTILPHSCAI